MASGDRETDDNEDSDAIDSEAVGSGGNDEESIPESRVIPVAASPVFAEPSTSATVVDHHHRHHHGELVEEEEVSAIPTHTSLLTSPVPYGTIMPTPTMVSMLPSLT